MKNRHMRVLPAMVAVVMLSICARLSAEAPAPPPAKAESTKFLRFIEDDDGGGRLETAIATYKNADGVAVHLVAAVHVGETKYYQDLANTFAAYDLLLYEMVKPKDMGAPEPGERRDHMIGMLQQTLKQVLELDFQLDAIDYRAKNFLHADLDAETFAKMQKEKGENLLVLMLRQMMAEMEKPQQKQQEISLPELLVALTSPDRARHLKMILARQFENLEAQVAGLEGPDGSVILTERNKAAMKVLQDTIGKGHKNLGLFYGAAHMMDIEERLLALEFKRTALEYRVAWDMTPKEGDIIIKKVTKKPTTRPVQ